MQYFKFKVLQVRSFDATPSPKCDATPSLMQLQLQNIMTQCFKFEVLQASLWDVLRDIFYILQYKNIYI